MRMRDDSAETDDPVPDGSTLQIYGMFQVLVLLVLIIKVMQIFHCS